MKIQISIRSKILLFMFLPILATFFLWSFFAYPTLEKSYRHEIASIYSEIIDSAIQRIALYVTIEADKLKPLARSPEIISAIEEAMGKYRAKSPEAVSKYLAEMDQAWLRGAGKDGRDLAEPILFSRASQILRLFQAYEKRGYKEIFVADGEGGLVAATNKTSDFYQADEFWWQAAHQDGGKIVVGDIEYDESAAVYSIVISLPVRKNAGGKVMGILKAVLDVNALFQGTEFAVGKTGMLRVFNKDGVIVFDLRPQYIHTLENLELMEKLKLGEKGFLLEKTEGLERFIVYRLVDFSELLGPNFITENQWYFCLKQDAYQAMAPLRNLVRLLTVRNGLITVFLLLGTLYLGRHFSQPLYQLARHTREIAAGNFGQRVDIRTNDEFRELGEAFNQMGERLDRFFQLTEASERRYKILFESAKEGILVLDLQKEIVVNANHYFVTVLGRSKESVVGRKLAHFLRECSSWESSPDGKPDEDRVQAGCQILLGQSEKKEITFLTRDGKRATFEVFPTVFTLDSKNYVECLFHDVTEKKQIEEVKNNLIRDVAHELRTPIAKLQISLDLLYGQAEKNPDGGERVGVLLGILKKSVVRLAGTIESILDFSRLQEGVVYLDKEKISLHDVVQDVLSEYQEMAKEKGLSMRASSLSKSVHVEGDKRLLRMALGNIISNAVKFTSQGSIDVRVLVQDNKAQVWVQDTGLGIARENIPQVFDKFFQVSPSIQGCGIGLAIADEILKLHGGKIWAESPGLGKGSVFKMEFPL